jgi:hypothetical protein
MHDGVDRLPSLHFFCLIESLDFDSTPRPGSLLCGRKMEKAYQECVVVSIPSLNLMSFEIFIFLVFSCSVRILLLNLLSHIFSFK